MMNQAGPPVPAFRRTFGDPIPVWAVFLLWWTGVALLFGWQRATMCACEGEPTIWGRSLLVGFVYSYSWGAIGLVAIWLAARFPPERLGWRQRLPLHLAIALPLITARSAVVLFVSDRLFPTEVGLHLGALIGDLPAALFIYLLLLRGAYAWRYFQRAQDRKAELAVLEARLAAARVDLLAVELQPDFIFTVLRRAAALARHDSEAAARVLTRLGELLRLMLSQRDSSEIPLGEEIRSLRLYLEIEKAVADDELEVTWSVDDDVLDAMVPRMILQPVVERLVRQGTSAGKRGLAIFVRRAGDAVAMELVCSLRPPPTAWMDGQTFESSAVVSALRSRMDGHYGAAHGCVVRSPGEGETVVSLLLPRRTAEPRGEEWGSAASAAGVGG
jgi:two-component system, LytTR family, sensor kinase